MKAPLGLGVGPKVGESWELSVEPDFPSRLEDGPLLEEAIQQDTQGWLGSEADNGSTGLLVKLLDAADDLSVQIHPTDDDPALADGESGKPEAWYIIDSEPGAGLYLGFRNGVTHEHVKAAIINEARVDELMEFVPTNPGDVFVIEPGTPHAVGRGVMLLEPQRVSPGKRGVTYRYWDWNRRYDADGQPDASGSPRALHVDRALDVTRWEGPRGRDLLDKVHSRFGTASPRNVAKLESMISATGPLKSTLFDVARLTGTGPATLPPSQTLRSLTVLEGQVSLPASAGNVVVAAGQTAALPACLPGLDVAAEGSHAVLCSLSPSP